VYDATALLLVDVKDVHYHIEDYLGHMLDESTWKTIRDDVLSITKRGE